MCDRGPRGPWGLCCCSNLSQERIDELGLDPRATNAKPQDVTGI